MKKIILCIVSILILSGCGNEAAPQRVTLKAQNVTGEGLTLLIEYSPEGEDVLQFDSGYKLQILENGSYEDVPYIVDPDKIPQTLELYQLSPGDSISLELYFVYAYGRLNEGKYRVCKNFGEEKLYAQFQIK